MISIVITTFNRGALVKRAIRSALDFCQALGGGEVICVDDFSSDGTVVDIQSAFAKDLQERKLSLVLNSENLGVTGAKNRGFEAARYPWVGFLDSDDFLRLEEVQAFKATLDKHPKTPILFFRCQDSGGHFVGTPFSEEQSLDLRRYLAFCSYGEALTFVNKPLIQGPPYLAELRGYEGLGCLRIIQTFGSAVLSPLILRIYDQSHPSRLSTLSGGFLKRLPLLAKGHRMVLHEFYAEMSPGHRFKLHLLSFVYGFLGKITW